MKVILVAHSLTVLRYPKSDHFGLESRNCLRNEGESAHIDTTTQETHTKGGD